MNKLILVLGAAMLTAIAVVTVLFAAETAADPAAVCNRPMTVPEPAALSLLIGVAVGISLLRERA